MIPARAMKPIIDVAVKKRLADAAMSAATAAGEPLLLEHFRAGSAWRRLLSDDYLDDGTTGALVVKKTGLTSHATTGVVTFPDGALGAATAYRVVWRMTSGGAEGLETPTAT